MAFLNLQEPLSPIIKKVGEPYLQLQIDSEVIAAFPMKDIQEAIVIPVERITPMPNMPDCVIGLLNQRSRIFWVVNLAQMLGLSSSLALEQLQHYNIVLAKVNNEPLALVVKEIAGVIRISSDSIQSPIGTVSSGLISYLQGCVLEEQKILLVLDAQAIVNSTILQNYQF